MSDDKNPFRFLNNILNGRESILESEEDEKNYPAFLINRGLSQYVDAVFYANEMNMMHHLPKKMQYDYLFRTIQKKKRGFGKWAKSSLKESTDITIIQAVYGISERKAREVMRLFPELGEQLMEQYGEKNGN